MKRIKKLFCFYLLSIILLTACNSEKLDIGKPNVEKPDDVDQAIWDDSFKMYKILSVGIETVLSDGVENAVYTMTVKELEFLGDYTNMATAMGSESSQYSETEKMIVGDSLALLLYLSEFQESENPTALEAMIDKYENLKEIYGE